MRLLADVKQVALSQKRLLMGQPGRPLSLRSNFIWTFVGNAVYSACQWGMLVMLVKLGSAEMVGRFSLGLVVSAPVIMFTNLQLRAVQATDARGEYTFADYLGLRLVMTIVALLVIAGIVLASGYRVETGLVVLVVGLGKAFEAISDVFYGLFQRHERMDRVAGSMITRGILSLAMLGGGVYLTGRVLVGAVGVAIAFLFVLATYDIRSGLWVRRAALRTNEIGLHANGWKSLLYPRWDPRTLIGLTRLALPLGIVMMLISLNTNVPRYVVERYLGERQLGIFAALTYLGVAGNRVIAALGRSATPRLAKLHARGDVDGFLALLLKLAVIGAFLGGAGVVVALVGGRSILTLLYRPEYAEHLVVFVWVMVATGIGYIGSFLGYGITATRAFSRFTIPYLVVSMICVASSVLLIPGYGRVGAAWALCLVNLAGCVAPIIILLTTIERGIDGAAS